MESHRYKKHRGAGSLPAEPVPNLERDPPAIQVSAIEVTEAALCRYENARGHRCRMLSAPGGELCAHHAQRLPLAKPDGEAQASDLLADINDFSTATSVNLFLGNLTRQLVRKRIQRRDALALAYLSQLLLNSLSAMNREEAEEAAKPREIIWDMPGPERERDSGDGNAAG
jgi:hypothetical protein